MKTKWLGLMIVLLSAVSLFADDQPWTTVGSAGTVDQANLLVINYDGPTATYFAFQRGGAIIRYNVVSVGGLTRRDVNTGYSLVVRYRATPDQVLPNKADSQVIAKLIEVNLTTGVSTTRLTFDSNNFAASSSLQTQSVSTCGVPFAFDFFSNAYYIETQLGKRSIVSGSPAVQAIQITEQPCGLQ